jgi:hypothetical protein
MIGFINMQEKLEQLKKPSGFGLGGSLILVSNSPLKSLQGRLVVFLSQ